MGYLRVFRLLRSYLYLSSEAKPAAKEVRLAVSGCFLPRSASDVDGVRAALNGMASEPIIGCPLQELYKPPCGEPLSCSIHGLK